MSEVLDRLKVAEDALADVRRLLEAIPQEYPKIEVNSQVDPQLVADLKRDEGLRLSAYPDPLTGGEPWTIGYGHTGPEVHRGLVWTHEEAENALVADAMSHIAQLDRALPWTARLDLPRKRVLYNMAFNIGVGTPGGTKGLLGFKNTLGMIERGDYAGAADGMARSLWARQVHARADRLVATMRTGV